MWYTSLMAERQQRDLDRVREAMRRHDEREGEDESERERDGVRREDEENDEDD